MNRDDIIRMAREAGFSLKNFAEPPNPYIHIFGYGETLERFAAIVAAAEREACARVCEDLEPDNRHEGAWIAGWCDGTNDCAAAIRARGETK